MSEIINENVTELTINENAPETAPEETAPLIENVPAENTFQLGKVSFVSLSFASQPTRRFNIVLSRQIPC